MRFITCGVTWGSNGRNFKEISHKLKIAILFKGNRGANTLDNMNIGTDYIALKHGFETFALGRSVNKTKGTWADLERLDQYTTLTPEEKDIIKEFDDEIIYIEVEKWIWFEDTPIDYSLRQSTAQIRNQEVYRRCSEIIDKYIEEQTMQKYIDLLEQQKNIVFTGAPGTGKTYLAKEIARAMTEENSPDKLQPIRDYYDSNQDYLKQEEAKCNELRNDFLNLFPLSNIKNITLDEYCLGYDKSENNFSEWIEFKLKPLGTMGSAASKIHLLYRPHDQQGKGTYMDYGTETPVDTIKKIGEAIYEIGTTGVYTGDLKYYRNWIMKVADAYSPDFYFPVYSEDHMRKICELFKITPNKDVYQMNRNIRDYFKQNIQDLSPWTIMAIVYKLFFEVQLKEIISYNPIENKEKATEFVQFHPSYDYTDFVEGLRPVQKENGEIGFELKDGVFKKLCIEAMKFPRNKFVMIIDEINRAELSKVFGELFFSIDPGYRGEKGKVQLQYSNLYNGESDIFDPFKEWFYVPKNVYIIATMNDIDRSIEPFDFAMKRRFAWCEVKPTEICDNMWVGQDGTPYPWATEAKNRMTELNNLIRKEFSSAYEIGGAYFLKLNALNGNFDLLWEYHIAPVIKDYLKGYNDLENELYKFKQTYDLNTSQTNNEMSNE